MNRLFTVLCALCIGASSVLKAEDSTKALRVGMELSYPPFEMTDAQGAPTGISVEIAQALGKYLGRPVEIVNIPFDGLIPSLRTGKIDLILSSMTATDERRKTIDFSEPYLTTGLCLLVSARSSVQKFEDLDEPGRTVVVKQGTTGHLFATKELRKAKVRVLDQETSCVLEVAQGRAEVFIYDQMSVYSNWKKNEGTTRPILKPFREEHWAVGIRKGNDELRRQVNDFLRVFAGEGGFEKLGDKYLSEQKKAFKERGIPFLF
jgi:polar amino acid transport system substrate-binding protein